MTRYVLVTGGTSGIGAAIAEAFLALGDQVLITGKTSDEVDRSRRQRPSLNALAMEVTDSTQISRVVGTFERLDVLVNCAGMILRDGQEHDLPGFEQVVDVNLTGTMRVARACRPLLEQHGGCAVNIASMFSFFGSGYAPAYSASKGGVVQLTRSLAIAWAPHVRVNAVAPGWIQTELTSALVGDPERSRRILERTPLGRWGMPEDVAGAVVFLCSPAARFITGAVVPVDGGYSAA